MEQDGVTDQEQKENKHSKAARAGRTSSNTTTGAFSDFVCIHQIPVPVPAPANNSIGDSDFDKALEVASRDFFGTTERGVSEVKSVASDAFDSVAVAGDLDKALEAASRDFFGGADQVLSGAGDIANALGELGSSEIVHHPVPQTMESAVGESKSWVDKCCPDTNSCCEMFNSCGETTNSCVDTIFNCCSGGADACELFFGCLWEGFKCIATEPCKLVGSCCDSCSEVSCSDVVCLIPC